MWVIFAVEGIFIGQKSPRQDTPALLWNVVCLRLRALMGYWDDC